MVKFARDVYNHITEQVLLWLPYLTFGVAAIILAAVSAEAIFCYYGITTRKLDLFHHSQRDSVEMVLFIVAEMGSHGNLSNHSHP